MGCGKTREIFYAYNHFPTNFFICPDYDFEKGGQIFYVRFFVKRCWFTGLVNKQFRPEWEFICILGDAFGSISWGLKDLKKSIKKSTSWISRLQTLFFYVTKKLQLFTGRSLQTTKNVLKVFYFCPKPQNHDSINSESFCRWLVN